MRLKSVDRKSYHRHNVLAPSVAATKQQKCCKFFFSRKQIKNLNEKAFPDILIAFQRFYEAPGLLPTKQFLQ